MNSILEFYRDEENFNQFLQFIQKKSDTALRTLDWFATNYTKLRKVNINGVDIQSDYRQQLKAYQKEYFDPFKRKTRIKLNWKVVNGNRLFNWKIIEKEKEKDKKVDKENTIITTIGQLNFFRWIIKRNILNFITENTKDIQDTQILYSKNKRHNQSKGTIIKNGPITHKTIQRIVIDFN